MYGVPEKELYFFNQAYVENPCLTNANYTRSTDWYHNFFKQTKSHQISGEICPAYLWDQAAPAKIFNYNPNVKLIVLLRNPVHRSVSQYAYYTQRGIIKNTSINIAFNNHSYLIDQSLYSVQLNRFFNIFPRKNILILFFEELMKDKVRVLKQVHTFLGVPDYTPLSIDSVINQSRAPKYPFINRVFYICKSFLHEHNLKLVLDILKKTGLSSTQEKIRTSTKEQKFLNQEQHQMISPKYLQILSEEIVNLEKLLNRSLNIWR